MMALIRLRLEFFLALAGSLYIATIGEATKTDSAAMREVEVYLTKKMPVNSDNVADMMVKLREKLKKEDKSHLFRKRDSNMVNVLKLLTELSLIDGDSSCSEKAYEVLKKCDRLTDNKAHQRWSPNEKHRMVDLIVHRYGMKRAERCLPVFARKYEEVMENKVDNEFHEYMKPFLTKIILRQICGALPEDNNLDTCGSAHDSTIEKVAGVRHFTPGDAVVILEELLMRSSPQDADELREAILESTHNDSKHYKAQKKLRSLVEKHLLSLCKSFVNKFPDKLFEQVEYDAKMLDKSIQSESLAAFHVGWANHRLCQALITEPEWLGKFILDDAATYEERCPSHDEQKGGHQHYPPNYPPPVGHYQPHHRHQTSPGRF